MLSYPVEVNETICIRKVCVETFSESLAVVLLVGIVIQEKSSLSRK